MGLVLLAAVVAAGCGDDDEDEAVSGDDGESTEENVLRVTEDDYTFAFDGEAKAGTVTFAIENVGEEMHMLGLCRLKAGKTLDDAKEAAGSDDEAAFDATCEEDEAIDSAGGGLTPGGAYEVTVDGIVAGDYAAVCFLPNEKGEPHFQLGMLGGFTVGEGEAGEQPAADVTYTATKEKLDGPKEVDAGPTQIRVVTEAGGPDEIVLLKLKDGKTADDVDAYFKVLDEGGFYEHDKSPVDFLFFAFDSTAPRTIGVDLDEGKWAISAEDSDVEGESPDPDEDPHVIQFTVS